MTVTITKLRQELFRLVDRAREGEPLHFTYKGSTFQIVPETKSPKLEKLPRQTVTAPRSRLKSASRVLLKEMQAEWEKDWAEL